MASDNESGDLQFEYDRSVVGVEVELGEFTISPDQIRAYCETMSEANPQYASGEIAPPGLLSAVSFGGGGNALDPKVKFGNTTFMAGSRMEFYAPIRANTQLKVATKIKEVYGKTGRSGTMVFVVRRTEFKNGDGHAVAALEQSIVHRETERVAS
jgi:hypothetical protein